jgi:poly(hydroxyalkanoate) depolymerase family esterase
MHDALLANSFLSWFTMATEASASFFAPVPRGFAAASVSSTQMTERHEGHCLYVPTTAPLRGAPLIVMLHGAGQDPDDFAAGTAMNSAAERHGFIVLYPAQSTRANAHRCWNWFDPAHQMRSQGEPAHLTALTLQVAFAHQVDTHRIYVAGLSAGGAMAALLGELFPDVYAAVGVHSGLAPRAGADLSSALAAMRGAARADSIPSGMPTIVFHGDRDSIVSPVNGSQVIEASLGANCPYESRAHTGADRRRYTRRKYFREGLGVCGEYWNLHDGAHAWSGGSSDGSFADPMGPDASEEMLRFFKDRQLSSRNGTQS